jgi:lipopolysaccharide/colanic/teichoic acid biosynthesis glycosyltransferase
MTQEAGQRGDLTLKSDARITPVGRFLRQYKLDELPQLLNILKGEMAFVGPRPELPNWTARYSREERTILQVRPGLTDPVQLMFRHEQNFLENAAQYELLFREKVARQLQYQEVRTPLKDLKVILQTIPAILNDNPGTEELAIYERIRQLTAQIGKQ